MCECARLTVLLFSNQREIPTPVVIGIHSVSLDLTAVMYVSFVCFVDVCFVNAFVQVEDLYYHKFTQGVLWPLFHCIPTNFNEALLENFQGQYEVRYHTRRCNTVVEGFRFARMPQMGCYAGP